MAIINPYSPNLATTNAVLASYNSNLAFPRVRFRRFQVHNFRRWQLRRWTRRQWVIVNPQVAA